MRSITSQNPRWLDTSSLDASGRRALCYTVVDGCCGHTELIAWSGNTGLSGAWKKFRSQAPMRTPPCDFTRNTVRRPDMIQSTLTCIVKLRNSLRRRRSRASDRQAGTPFRLIDNATGVDDRVRRAVGKTPASLSPHGSRLYAIPAEQLSVKAYPLGRSKFLTSTDQVQ